MVMQAWNIHIRLKTITKHPVRLESDMCVCDEWYWTVLLSLREIICGCDVFTFFIIAWLVLFMREIKHSTRLHTIKKQSHEFFNLVDNEDVKWHIYLNDIVTFNVTSSSWDLRFLWSLQQGENLNSINVKLNWKCSRRKWDFSL